MAQRVEASGAHARGRGQARCLQFVQMLQSVRELLLPAVQGRLLLLVNHVVSREPAARERLAAHGGKRLCVRLVDAPGWWPALPPLHTAVTPAGLFDSSAEAGMAEPDLTLSVTPPTPARWLDIAAGRGLPEVRIEGAADLAADMHWLVDNLRWDLEGDLAQAIGPMPARVVMSVGRAGAHTLRRTVAGAR